MKVSLKRHEAIDSGDTAAGVRKGRPHRVQQPEQQEGGKDGKECEHRAGLATEQGRPDQVKVFHAGAASALATSVPLSRCST